MSFQKKFFSQTLVRLITELARSVGAAVCMEEVETGNRRDICKRYHIDYI